MQLWVNRRQQRLTQAFLAELRQVDDFPARGNAALAGALEDDRYREYYDRRHLIALGREDLWPQLREFWPKRGPQWDALA